MTMVARIACGVDPSTERSSSFSGQARLWRAALVIAATGALTGTINVDAFQVNTNPLLARMTDTRSAQATLLRSSSVAFASALMEEAKAGLGRHERLNDNKVSPFRMFLKSKQASSCKPMSSFLSDFFENGVATNRPRRTCPEDLPVAVMSQRNRGILGFAIHDHGHQVVPTKNGLPSMLAAEEPSTSLKAATGHSHERRQRSTSGLDFQVWELPENLDEEWLSSSSPSDQTTMTRPSNHNHLMNHNPILNRLPKSVDEDDGIGTAPAWFPWMPSITQIEALKVRELKRICADRGLIQSGNKVDLQQRLWEWTRTQEHRQRRLMIGSNSFRDYVDGRTSPPKRFRIESSITNKPLLDRVDIESRTSTSANSLGEWARTYSIEPLVQRREMIHKEKREGKAVANRHFGSEATRHMQQAMPTKEYLSKLFEAPASQYSNLEVKQMYAAAKTADKNVDRGVTRQILQKLKEATPHDARIYRRLARLEKEEGNVDQARDVMRDGLKLHPNNAYLWHGLGQLEMKSGDEDAARKYYMKAIQLDPAFPNPYHALATTEHSKGHIAKAMKLLKAGLQYCPTNHRLHHALGDLYREAKMLEMAEKSFLRALDHGQEVSRGFAYTSLSHVAYELGDIDKCRSWLRKAISVNHGRHAKGWISLSRLEESEGDIDAARAVCIAGLNNYEKGLLNRSKAKYPQRSAEASSTTSLLSDPVQVKNQTLEKIPKYRSGDQFLVVYRNWARLEERYGTPESVDDVYSRASTAFPLDWQLPLEWAKYNARNGHFERARLLFSEACHKVANKHADPYRLFAEFEMGQGRNTEAREILYHGALVMSDAADGGLENRGGLAELFHTWAVCEWYLDNLSRAEVLFDHALRLTSSGSKGGTLRSYILYSIARLEFEIGEYHLAQHCVGLCLKENSFPGGNSQVWELWADVALALGDERLSQQCAGQASVSKANDGSRGDSGFAVLRAMTDPASLSLKDADMQKLMRKDPWHHKVFDVGRSESSAFFGRVPLPGPQRKNL